MPGSSATAGCAADGAWAAVVNDDDVFHADTVLIDNYLTEQSPDIAQGVDAYITGEISEQNFHLANETGVAFIAAGHHATERFGIQALGEHLTKHFDLEHRFFDQDNPI